MTPDRSEQIQAIFLLARDLENEVERQAYLNYACANDEDLRSAVERMLMQSDGDETLVKETLDWSASAIDPLLGTRFGAYQILSELGQGGMGAVYLAERVDGAYKQNVAIKFVKRGMDTNSVLRRFRNERQILAALHHPNIALLYDGGTTPDGLPYFVMEYIEGEPLYRYCDNRKLNVNERLRLFVQVCEAVHAAHKIKVVHRDLKPSNILVNANGTPKLLDFGIAKLLNAEIADATIEPTATQMRVMTPEYASPEQVMGSEITPASDIYSLGVLLYELLSGHRPYRLKNRAPFEIARVICEEPPESLSDSLNSNETFWETGEPASLEKILSARRANLLQLRHELSGDLQQIVMNALHKKPEDRYATALELAEDIRLYLQSKAIRKKYAPAAPPHKDTKTSLAVLPLKLIGVSNTEDSGEMFLGVGLADALILRLSQVQRFIVRPTSSVLRYQTVETDPFAAGRELAVECVVEGTIRRAGERIRVSVRLLDTKTQTARWAEQFDEKFTDVLELEDSISARVTNALIPHLTGEEQKQLAKRSTNRPEAYEAYLRGRYHWNQFTPEALPKAQAAFESAIALDPDYALAYVGLADFYIWAMIYGLMPSLPALEKAEQLARQAIALNAELGEAYSTIALVFQNQKRWDESEVFSKRAIQLTPNYPHAHEWYGSILVGTGRTEEGVAEMKLTDRLDPLSLRTKTLVAWTLYQAHRFTEALNYAQQIVDLDKNYPMGYSQLGLNLLALGRTAEALPLFQKFDAMIPDSALAKYQLCFAYVGAGQIEAARTVFAQIKSLTAAGHVKPYFLALAHTALGEYDAALSYFEQAIAENEPWMLWLGTEPMLSGLHDDARFVGLLEKMGNPIVEWYRKS